MIAGRLCKNNAKKISQNPDAVSKTSRENKDKKIRDDAANAFNDILSKYVEVAEAEINAILENKKADDKLRGFKRPDLERHLNDNIKTETVDSLVRAVTKKFYISAEFYKLKLRIY